MVEYSLTPMGRLFIEPIEMLYAWAAKNDDALTALDAALLYDGVSPS
jgi:DNA-binding HxlR family transcriptional regulator